MKPTKKANRVISAERQGSATGYRQRPFDLKVEVVNVMALSTRGG
jgi:hypothetical protein